MANDTPSRWRTGCITGIPCACIRSCTFSICTASLLSAGWLASVESLLLAFSAAVSTHEGDVWKINTPHKYEVPKLVCGFTWPYYSKILWTSVWMWVTLYLTHPASIQLPLPGLGRFRCVRQCCVAVALRVLCGSLCGHSLCRHNLCRFDGLHGGPKAVTFQGLSSQCQWC